MRWAGMTLLAFGEVIWTGTHVLILKVRLRMSAMGR